MTQLSRPPVWQMVKEAADHFAGPMTYSQIRGFIHAKYGEVNDSTITCQIIIASVNHASRIHYPENTRPRAAVSQYDFLFNTGRGQCDPYDPAVHGSWEICAGEDGTVFVSQCGASEGAAPPVSSPDESLVFGLERELRDFIAQNITKISPGGRKLTLYADDGGDGVEYPTDVGRIDILAVDEAGDFHVLELKLLRGPDAAAGQLLRYMGWVKAKLAGSKQVNGIVVAQRIDEKLKYAVSMVPNVALFEYSVQFALNAATLS